MSRKFIFGGSFLSALDPDADAFIIASGITDDTQKNAVNQLVLELKFFGIWNKIKVFYPNIGGTSFSCKWNLKDPRDLDVAFRMTFFGGITFTNGLLSNGTNGYANTHFIPSVNLTNNDTAIFYKSTTNIAGAYAEFGAFTATGAFGLYNYLGMQYCNKYTNGVGDGTVNIAQVDTSGFYTGTRISSIDFRLFRNGSQIGTTRINPTGGTVANSNQTLYLGAFNNNGVTQFFAPRNITVAGISDGLTPTDVTNLHSAISTFDTTLGR